MSLKILVVDDNKTIRMFVNNSFKPFGCEIFEAENGIEGLVLAMREKPDLILLDLSMPLMSGAEMLGRLKSEPALKDIPVIMLTAESGGDHVLKIVRMGVRDYILKPFRRDQLIEKVKKWVKLESIARAQEAVSPFSVEGDITCLALARKVSKAIVLQVAGLLEPKLSEMAQSGMDKLILDFSKETEIHSSLINLTVFIIRKCQYSNVRIRVVGNSTIRDGLQEIRETSEIPVEPTIEQAIAAFNNSRNREPYLNS
jgi:CheY-like chemotaxis protein